MKVGERRIITIVALTVTVLGWLAVTAGRALAEDRDSPTPQPTPAAPSPPADEPFETSWFGLRPEFWYAPTLGLQGKVGGTYQNLPSTIGVSQGSLSLPSRFDANKDLGIADHSPIMSALPQVPGPLGLEMFCDTRWVSLSLWGVAPFEYHGHTVIQENLTIDGFTFSAQRPVETTLEQAIVGMDVKCNLINNRFVRISPILALRALAINWTFKDTGEPPLVGAKVSTDDVTLPLTIGRFQVLPYPEVGGEVRAGSRDFIEADLKLTAMDFDFDKVAATTALVDGGLTGYWPWLPELGARLGYRYYYIHARTTNEKATHDLDVQMRLSGFTFSLLVRF